MTSYSPFDKPLNDLESADLAVLRAVPESWHVEYKLAIDDAKTLAKAIGAFANTYGGWLIVGVEEGAGAENTAQGFPGLSDEELSLLLKRLASSINAYLRPVPHYEHRVLKGPCGAIDLTDNRAIVVVYVPMSVHTPHLQRDGRVYQRVGDTSQPRSITERRQLDELWQRADSVRKTTQLWIDDDPEFSPEEGETLYLRLMLVPDPWNKKHQLPLLSPRQFQDVLNQPHLGMSITFDSVFSTSNGYIARHVLSNDPRHLGLTISTYRDYSCDIIIPLNVVSGVSNQLIQFLADQYEHAESYVQLLIDRGYWREHEGTELSVVDLNPLLNLLIAITSQYRALLRLATPDPAFYFKARVLQAGRIVPFLDVPQIIESFTRYGVPMLMRNEVTIPPGTDPDTFVPVGTSPEGGTEAEDEFSRSIDQAISILMRVFVAFGVSGLLNDEGGMTEGAAQALYEASRRSTPINVVLLRETD